jgi:pterin-4a-carbinolamine dehydratase
MDMLKGEQIAGANLTDWRKLALGLHARYVVDDFGAGARFVAAVGEAGDALGHHPRVSIGNGYVDLKLVTDVRPTGVSGCGAIEQRRCRRRAFGQKSAESRTSGSGVRGSGHPAAVGGLVQRSRDTP